MLSTDADNQAQLFSEEAHSALYARATHARPGPGNRKPMPLPIKL